MHKTFTSLALAGAMVAAAAAPAAATPTTQDRTNAAKECRAEQGTTSATREAFAAKYGTNGNDKNAFGKCVSQRAKDEEGERKTARANAPETCRTEQGTTDASRAAFAAKYGTNRNDKNAFGKCVSAAARAAEQRADEADAKERTARRNAARTCATERGTTDASRKTFAEKYGTNANDRNAFGRCVSRTAQAEQS